MPESFAAVIRASDSLPGGQPSKAVRTLSFSASLARRRGLTLLGPDDVVTPPSLS